MSQEQAPREPRELSPYQKFWGDDGISKDFSPRPVPSETKEVDEVLSSAPKGLRAQESAMSSESKTLNVPPESEIRVLPGSTLPTDLLLDAARANGKDSDENEGEPVSPKTQTPDPATSSPASSSKPSPGANKQPAPAKPPVVASPPAGPTIQK